MDTNERIRPIGRKAENGYCIAQKYKAVNINTDKSSKI